MKMFEQKKEIYEQAGVRQTAFREKRYTWDDGGIIQHGFFTPYQSFKDFQSQLKAPVVMPIICAANTLSLGVQTLKDLFLSVVNFAILDFRQGAGHIGEAFCNGIAGIYYAFSAVMDALKETVSLLTRSLTTPVLGLIHALQRRDDTTPVVVVDPRYTGHSHHHGHPTTTSYEQQQPGIFSHHTTEDSSFQPPFNPNSTY